MKHSAVRELFRKHSGELIAGMILLAWCTSTVLLLGMPVRFTSPLTYLFLLVQTHLCTGLFVTAHDAVHGAVSRKNVVNAVIGSITTLLYFALPYPLFYRRHEEHHTAVMLAEGSESPRAGVGGWYVQFVKQYVSVFQVLIVGCGFAVLVNFFSPLNLFFFWGLPSMLSTLQLFYFSEYLPHRHPARSSPEHSHSLWHAFLTCYFVGRYHREHHRSPATPWWRLHTL